MEPPVAVRSMVIEKKKDEFFSRRIPKPVSKKLHPPFWMVFICNCKTDARGITSGRNSITLAVNEAGRELRDAKNKFVNRDRKTIFS